MYLQVEKYFIMLLYINTLRSLRPCARKNYRSIEKDKKYVTTSFI